MELDVLKWETLFVGGRDGDGDGEEEMVSFCVI